MIPISAKADDLDKIPAPDKILILPMGKAAPYSGILITEDDFRFWKTTELELEIVKTHVEKPATMTQSILIFLGGVVLGGLATSALK